MEVIEGKKRFSKIFIDDDLHVYHSNKIKRDGSIILKCCIPCCLGSGVYLPQHIPIFRRLSEHNHQPNENYVNKCKILNLMKIRAENETTALKQIYYEEISKKPTIEFPSYTHLESTLHKRRRSKVPSEPETPEEAAQDFQTSLFCRTFTFNFFKSFLRLDDGNQLLIFASRIHSLKDTDAFRHLHVDSNFSIIPKMFNKLIIISIVVNNYQLLPIFYVLMVNASTASYDALFKFLLSEYDALKPHVITTDFDQALEQSLYGSFPLTDIEGSWFHYIQSIWRSINTTQLAQVFFQDENAKGIIKSVMAIPLLPPELINEGLLEIQKQIIKTYFHLTKTKNSLLDLIQYVFDQWLNIVGPSKLSIFYGTRQHNYGIDGFYQFLIKKLGVGTPKLIKFVEKLFQADDVFVKDFESINDGKKRGRGKTRFVVANEKLVKENYTNLLDKKISSIEFLNLSRPVIPYHFHSDHLCDPASLPHPMEDLSDNITGEESNFCQIGVYDQVFYPPCDKISSTSSTGEENVKNERVTISSPVYRFFTISSTAASTSNSSYQICSSQESKREGPVDHLFVPIDPKLESD